MVKLLIAAVALHSNVCAEPDFVDLGSAQPRSSKFGSPQAELQEADLQVQLLDRVAELKHARARVEDSIEQLTSFDTPVEALKANLAALDKADSPASVQGQSKAKVVNELQTNAGGSWTTDFGDWQITSGGIVEIGEGRRRNLQQGSFGFSLSFIGDEDEQGGSVEINDYGRRSILSQTEGRRQLLQDPNSCFPFNNAGTQGQQPCRYCSSNLRSCCTEICDNLTSCQCVDADEYQYMFARHQFADWYMKYNTATGNVAEHTCSGVFNEAGWNLKKFNPPTFDEFEANDPGSWEDATCPPTPNPTSAPPPPPMNNGKGRRGL